MPQFSEDHEDQPLGGKRILLAEDEERLRIIMAMMIEELGAEVIKVADGKSALDAYQRETDGIDLVLLDIRMTGLSGVAVFERLIELDPDVKVVLSSGVLPGDDLVEMLTRHRGGFIEKPFNLNRLAEVLTKVLSGESIVVKL